MAKILTLFLLIATLQAEIIETNRMEDILPYVDKETWVLFDIDDTLLESELQVGRPKWFFHEVKKLTEQGHEHVAAVYLCYPEWIWSQEICPIRTPEPEIAALVQKVQQAAAAVFGLTARHPSICPATLKQLGRLGIDLAGTAPSYPNLETAIPHHWEKGVLFLTDFNRKGATFRKWVENSETVPSKVILVDDSRHNLVDMEKEMDELGIPCTCFHYTKTFERPFDPEVATREYMSLTGF